MKKHLQVLSALVVALTIVFAQTTAFAAAALPTAAVWFSPATGSVGSAITLNTLVYNSQSVNATVTVEFKTSAAAIGTAKETITTKSAKTISVPWTIPTTPTAVTATVTAATDSHDKSLPVLLGPLGTITVGAAQVPALSGVSFPGSSQLSAWFTPLLAKIEAFRVKEAAIFTAQRNDARKKIGLVAVPPTSVSQTIPETPAPAVTPVTQTTAVGTASTAANNPADYATVLYTTVLASLFSNAAIFYIVLALLILLLLRFIVNLVF